jgi:signal transduction histidine kinase
MLNTKRHTVPFSSSESHGSNFAGGPQLKETFTQKDTYTLKFGLPIAVSLGVFAIWFNGRQFIEILTSLLSPKKEAYSQFYWQEFFLLFLSGTLVGLLIEKLNFKRTFIYLSIFWLLWFVTCIITARFSSDLLFLPVFLTTLTVFVSIKAKRLWQTDMMLHEKLGLLSVKTLSFEAKSAIARTDSCVNLLKTVLPIKEIIIFKLDNQGGLTPISRAREATRASGNSRQESWREGIRLCELSLAKKDLVVEQRGGSGDETKIALPLVQEGTAVGTLFIKSEEKFGAKDLALLEALSEQLSVNFQRELTREKDYTWKWWKSFSLEAAMNRLELCDLTTGYVNEQSIGLMALSKSNDAHAIANLDGTIHFMNPQMKQLANLTSEESSTLDIFKLLDRFQTDMLGEPNLIVSRVLQSDEGFEKELSFPEKNLTLVFKLSLVKAPADGGSIHETYAATKPLCFLMTLRDISSQKELEKLRSDMVSLMSHELRTPITSIKGFAELLQDDDTLPLEAREFLTIIADESNRLSKMLTTFLSVAKLQQHDKRDVVKTPVKLDLIVKEVVGEMQESARKKRIRLVETANPFIPPIVVDRSMIVRAVSHLVDNAIKYSPEKTSVSVSTTLEREHLRVTVEDRGIGIPAGELDKVWQNFYRSESNVKQEGSTGLGLPLVKEIVEQHGGNVEVESEVGHGSKFSFVLPRL